MMMLAVDCPAAGGCPDVSSLGPAHVVALTVALAGLVAAGVALWQDGALRRRGVTALVVAGTSTIVAALWLWNEQVLEDEVIGVLIAFGVVDLLLLYRGAFLTDRRRVREERP